MSGVSGVKHLEERLARLERGAQLWRYFAGVCLGAMACWGVVSWAAWTAPKTDWATGEIVAASDMNEIGNNLRFLKGLDGTITVEDVITINSGGAPDATVGEGGISINDAGTITYDFKNLGSGNIGIEVGSSAEIILKEDGSSGGCIQIEDTDEAGDTKCMALNGTLSCSIGEC